jgi:hypothetical protein
MDRGRVVLVATCVVVAGLAGWFAVAQWDQTNRVATAVSALGAVAAVGVAVWAVLRPAPRPVPRGQWTASGTGEATGRGGEANSGIEVQGGPEQGPRVARVEDSGAARASDDGQANTGIRITD